MQASATLSRARVTEVPETDRQADGLHDQGECAASEGRFNEGCGGRWRRWPPAVVTQADDLEQEGGPSATSFQPPAEAVACACRGRALRSVLSSSRRRSVILVAAVPASGTQSWFPSTKCMYCQL